MGEIVNIFDYKKEEQKLTREAVLQTAKSVVFKEQMVLAILNGQKTEARFAVKYKYDNTEMRMKKDKYGTRLIEIMKDVEGETYGTYPDGRTWHKILPYIEPKPRYKKGDILYVREVFCKHEGTYYFRNDERLDADTIASESLKFQSPLQMPKEAARIFLLVTDVRAERLQDITEDSAIAEGTRGYLTDTKFRVSPVCHYMEIWESFTKRDERDIYGWAANPWVWVVSFERIFPD